MEKNYADWIAVSFVVVMLLAVPVLASIEYINSARDRRRRLTEKRKSIQ